MKHLYQTIFSGAKLSGIGLSTLFLSATLLLAGCATSNRFLDPEPDWVFLAQGKVNHIREKDVFEINTSDQFAALKVYVFHRAVTIKSMDITLINGDVLRPELSLTIPAGERSKIIELSSDGRQISKIVLRYRSEGRLFSDKALVQIGGLRPYRYVRPY